MLYPKSLDPKTLYSNNPKPSEGAEGGDTFAN